MKTIALLVGVSEYRDTFYTPLPGAKSDAERFREALIAWGVPKQWIFSLYDEAATKANLIKTFYECRSFFDKDAKLIFYFAGHGTREYYLEESVPESALILHDTLSDDALMTGMRMVELMQLIRVLKPQQVFSFIDACSLRINQIDNPLNDNDIFSTAHTKGFFCLLSSGIQKSYEDTKLKTGYFTHALLKAINELKDTPEPGCQDIARKVSHAMKEQSLPGIEVYHIGQEAMWPLEKVYKVTEEITPKTNSELVYRKEAIEYVKDTIIRFQQPILWMWGERGRGKTVIAEQLTRNYEQSLYVTIPSHPTSYSTTLQNIIEQIRLKKSELFFNRPSDAFLSHALRHIITTAGELCLVIDHLDRLTSDDLQRLIAELIQVPLPLICISRNRCPQALFSAKEMGRKVIEWRASPLNLDEISEIAAASSLDTAFTQVLLNATEGNALKVRQLILKIAGPDISAKGNTPEEFVHPIRSIAACGGFYDQFLFCETFQISSHTLLKLEKLGLIQYHKEGCFPHDLLLEMVEENDWTLDLQKAAEYWNFQVQQTPYNRSACRSFVVAAASIDQPGIYKSSLTHCLETLNAREYVNFLVDLVRIFQKESWEDLLLKASEYLLHYEEYQVTEEILSKLTQSKRRSIQHAALRNEARRMLWLGQSKDCIELSMSLLQKNPSHHDLLHLINNLGISFHFIGDWERSLEWLQKNIHHAGPKIDECEVGLAKTIASTILTCTGNQVMKAKEMIESSLQVFESAQHYIFMLIGLNALCDVYYRFNQWSQGLVYLKNAEDIATTMGHKTYLLFTLRNKAKLYLRLYGSDSQELSEVVGRIEKLLFEMAGTRGSFAVLFALNTLGAIYAHRQEVMKLEYVLNKLAPFSHFFKEVHVYTTSNLGHLATLKMDHERAKSHYEKAYALSNDLKTDLFSYEIYHDFIGCGFPSSLQDFVNIPILADQLTHA